VSGFIPHFFRGELAGRVVSGGLPVELTPLAEMVSRVGLVFQDPFSQITGARMTVRGEVAFGLENMGLDRAEILDRTEHMLARVGLAALADRSPVRLSGGQSQRLAIASILVMRPQVLVLDEPTSQLDPAGRRAFFEFVRELILEGRTTVLLVEQNLEWVGAYADRVVALAGGRVVADGEPRAVLSDPDLAAHGIGQTRYTRVALEARRRGLLPAEGPLPVSLEQAAQVFR
jgi:energy-coupling factor transporter ATP-binding protein EcfA2